MTPSEAHRDLALMLLVGRSIKRLPWSLDEDQVWVARERVLWAQLSEEEREVAQKELRALWGHRGASRTVPVNPQWGDWTQPLGETITIPDTAFGLPDVDFRPQVKGVSILSQEHPELGGLLQWLWQRGFHPVEVRDQKILVLSIPSHRITQESERLMGLLTRDWTTVPLSPHLRNQDVSLTIHGVYDPVSGRASIWLAGHSLGL